MSTTSATIQPYDVSALEDAGIPTLPAEREALRRHLLEAIARIRPILEADAEVSDTGGTHTGLAVGGGAVSGRFAVAQGAAGTGRAGG